MLIKILIISVMLLYATLQLCPNNCDNCTSNVCYKCTTNFTIFNNTCIDCNNCTLNCQKCRPQSQLPKQDTIVQLRLKIMAGVMIFGFLFITLAVWIYHNCCSKPATVNQDNHRIQSNVRLTDSTKRFHLKRLSWMKCQQIILHDQTCSICLQKQTNLLTDCHHNYHIACVAQWMKYRPFTCPLCKNNKPSTKFMIPCKKCQLYEIKISCNLLDMLIKEQQWTHCSSCKEKSSQKMLKAQSNSQTHEVIEVN